MYCFKHNIPAEIAGSVVNLQLLPGEKNIAKHDKVNHNDIQFLESLVNVLSVDNPVVHEGKLNIWRHELNIDVVNSMLIYRAGKAKKVNARDLEIREVHASEASAFLKRSHLAGCHGASYRFGLYNGNELMMIITLAKPRFSKKYDLEVIRLAIKPGYAVRGGASKLFKHIFKRFPTAKILSYSDNFMSGTVMVVYFTSEKHIISMRDTQFKVSTSKIKSSVGKCEQITTVDKSCLGDYIGDISDEDMKLLNKAILSATGVTQDDIKSCLPEMFNDAQNEVQMLTLRDKIERLTEENADLKDKAADAEKYKFSYNQLLSGIVGNKA
jgi:mRNA-degrading endonuclease toxin of MazEF toxin-antitoxin module